MAWEAIAFVLAGALAGGLVNGLTGFGTGISALGIWLHALPPMTAASLVVICSVVSQLQTLPLIWGRVEWRRVLPFVLPGLLGVPVGAWLLPLVPAQAFRAAVGLFLILYAGRALLRRPGARGFAGGGRLADGTVGLAGGVLGGIAGLSGVLLVVWTDLRAWTKEQRRMVLQSFNLGVLGFALASHATAGLLTREVGWATLAALPGTLGGAWAGAAIYRRLGDRGFQRVVLVLLLVSGLALLLTAFGG